MKSECNDKQSKIEWIIDRPDKGLKMKFFQDCVIKDLSSEPQHPNISRQNQTHRLINEIAAYKRFNELKCPFVPKLLDSSIEQRFLAISRIKGENLLVLLGKKQLWHSTRSILHQIDSMNFWLKSHNISNMDNNLKDLILDKTGKLYLVDFEPYKPNTKDNRKIDIYNEIIFDILERILIRSVRKVQVTKQFLFFSMNVFMKRPIKTIRLTFRCLISNRKSSWWFRKIVNIWRHLKVFS